MVIKRKRNIFIYIFYDLEGRVSFAYVPARDQNLVVRGKNPSDLFDVFYFFGKKGFEKGSGNQGKGWFVVDHMVFVNSVGMVLEGR
jgi:hypothetical protein